MLDYFWGDKYSNDRPRNGWGSDCVHNARILLSHLDIGTNFVMKYGSTPYRNNAATKWQKRNYINVDESIVCYKPSPPICPQTTLSFKSVWEPVNGQESWQEMHLKMGFSLDSSGSAILTELTFAYMHVQSKRKLTIHTNTDINLERFTSTI